MVIAFTARTLYYRILIQFFSSLSLPTVVNVALVIQVHQSTDRDKQLVASLCACKQNGFSCFWPGKKGLLPFQQVVSELLSHQSEFSKNRPFSTCPFSREDQLFIFTVNVQQKVYSYSIFNALLSFLLDFGLYQQPANHFTKWPSFYLLTGTGQYLVIPAVFQLLSVVCYQQSHVTEREN